MSGKPDTPGPKPPEALGIADLITQHVVDHKPGYDQTPPPAVLDEGQGELPPHKPDAAPRTSLSERLRQGLTNEEETK
jgi:hypothetical protein